MGTSGAAQHVKWDGQLIERLTCCLCARSTMSLFQMTQCSPGAELQKPGPGILTDTPDPNFALSKNMRHDEEGQDIECLYPCILSGFPNMFVTGDGLKIKLHGKPKI